MPPKIAQLISVLSLSIMLACYIIARNRKLNRLKIVLTSVDIYHNCAVEGWTKFIEATGDSGYKGDRYFHLSTNKIPWQAYNLTRSRWEILK